LNNHTAAEPAVWTPGAAAESARASKPDHRKVVFFRIHFED